MYKNLANTLFLAKQIISMPTCHSTNDLAQEMAQKPDISEGTVVICEEQTGGKGQRGNTWESVAGKNLTLSVILNPKFLRIEKQFYLNMMASLAVRDAIAYFLPAAEVKVKWPNDVLLNGKKVTGILIENSINTSGIEYAVVGMGVNVNQEKFSSPRATSMRLGLQEELDKTEVFDVLMSFLEGYYLKLKAAKLPEVKAEYLKHLFGYKEKRKYLTEYRFEGVIEGVTDAGLLVVAGPQQRQEYDLKEIEFIY